MASNVTDPRIPSDMDIINLLNHKKAVQLIPAITYTVILMVIGLIGNPLAIYIYGWRWQKTTTRNFLLCLAVVDLINCFITMPTEIAVMTKFYFFDNGNVCKMSRFTTYVMNNATSFIFVIVSVDRYIRICKPHNQPISPRGALIGCGIAAIIGISVSWPALVMYGREELPIKLPNGRIIQGVMCLVENEYENTPYPFAFFIYLWVGVSGTAIVIITMYILIGRAILQRNKKKRARSQSAQATMQKYRNASNSTDHEVFLPQTPTLGPPKLHCNTEDAAKNATPSEATSESPMTSPISPNGSKNQKGFSFPRGVALSVASKWSKSKFRGGRSTLMLFAITVVYVLSFVPFLIITTIRTHVGSSFYPKLSIQEQVVVNIFIRSYLINNCANPIVYGFCNSQFRNECKKLFKWMCCRGEGYLNRGSSNRAGGSSMQEQRGQ
ncbi:hypothetical protein SNE40_021644 [Patella caerulea]|uniref:G-protein coupled receptors family 1 profile domain-containing protein n=2 Tax=Patella caerulea TaxID=87958 RepID=A0AAN8J0N6_PATCE